MSKYVPKYLVKSNPKLDEDYYKEFHGRCLPKGMTKSVSYFTPRRSRVSQWPECVIHGYQAFVKRILIDEWNEKFFCRPCNEVVEEYSRIIENTMGQCDKNRIVDLWELGYLPIEIYALPEGTLCPMGVPFFSMTNTHPDYCWLPQALESLISAELWKPIITATVGHTYRGIVNKWYDKTCDDNVPRRFALGNFDYRGDAGRDEALACASGWLLSFVNTATVMSVPYMEAMYSCDCTKEEVGRGANSTEHFVMCSNSENDIRNNPGYEFVKEDPRRELIFIKRLLTEICPNENVSCVLDSYDYYRTLNNLKLIKDTIMNHNGCFLVRGDSGDCVKILVDTVEILARDFGYTVNSKGYKVLDPHVKALYGDSIQPQTAEKIYEELEKRGFASCNVSLGVGSFSMHCLMEKSVKHLVPETKFGKFLEKVFPKAFNFEVDTPQVYTRDTFSTACKSQDAVIDGIEIPIFKDPATDKGTGFSFKKSHKGCCRVYYGKGGNILCKDNLTYEESLKDTIMIPVFRDGEIVTDQTLSEIRDRLNNGNF